MILTKSYPIAPLSAKLSFTFDVDIFTGDIFVNTTIDFGNGLKFKFDGDENGSVNYDDYQTELTDILGDFLNDYSIEYPKFESFGSEFLKNVQLYYDTFIRSVDASVHAIE